MASYSWNGGMGSYLDPMQWTPSTVPLYGSDTVATINAGTVSLSGTEPNGITLLWSNLDDFRPAASKLVLDNAALGPEMTLGISGFVVLEVDGYDTDYGTVALGDPAAFADVAVQSDGFGQLNQDGTVLVGPSTGIGFGTTTRLNNDGVIELTGGNVNTQGAISGNGTIELASPSSTMTVSAGVEAGQAFAMQQGTLAIDDYAGFQGTLAGFNSGAAAVALRLQFDAATDIQDSSGEHLVLTDNGVTVGELQLADTPDTQYAVTKSDPVTVVRPTTVHSDGSIPGRITTDSITIRNAEPDGQTVALGAPSPPRFLAPTLTLDNAALGPDLLLTVASPDATGPQAGTLTVQGDDTNYGEIDILPPADAQATGRGNTLTVDMQPGSQLNQEGTVRVASLPPGSVLGSSLVFNGSGTLNNDGQISIEPGGNADIDVDTIGSGTITVDHGSLTLFNVASTQTVDFLGGTIYASSAFNATIKDWDSEGRIVLGSSVSSVQFDQTSASGGDLQLFAGAAQVGALHLLGTYATSDFTLTPGYQAVSISASGKLPLG